MGERVPACVNCGSSAVTRVALFGGQLMSSRYRCDQCGDFFENVRWENQESHGDTLPGILLRKAKEQPHAVALRAKRRGIYRDITWAQYLKHVEAVCFGFRALGLAPGDRVAVLGDACPEWLFTELGTLAAGGICYGIYPTSPPAQVAALLEHAGASIAVVRDQESADKILGLPRSPAALRRIVVIDPQGMFACEDPRVITLDEVMQLAPRPGPSLERLIEGLDPDEPALIVFTSGTTGDPRGAVHSHRTLIAGAADYLACLVPDTQRTWRTVCHLPLNHIFEQYNSIMLPLMGPVVPHFGERRSLATDTLFEVAPDLYASVPRYWQKMASHILVGIENSSPLNRFVYRTSVAVGRRALDSRGNGPRWRWWPWWLKPLQKLARLVTFQPLLDKVGLRRVRVGVSGGGPIPPEVQKLWQIWGVNLKNLYGQTEGGFIAVQRGEFPEPGAVGEAAPGASVRLADDGEILVRGSGSFVGYWNDEAATREIRQDGWVATGDVGEFVGDNLRIVDRKKDILITQGGKNITPQLIEDKLRTSPYVAEAVVFGDGRKYLVALIEIDEETVSQWARTRGIAYGGFSDLAASPDVEKLIQDVVHTANEGLSRPEQVKAFRILPRALDPEVEGEPVTPTRKVKRKHMYERFRTLVESMYQEDEIGHIGEHVTHRYA